jgi:hypothetical protein
VCHGIPVAQSGANAISQETNAMTTTRRSLPVVLVVLLMSLLTLPKTALAQKLTDAELRKMGASAATAADHKKLAAHYRAHAAEHEADAKLHEEIVTAARKQDQSSGHAWELARGAAHYAEHSHEAAEALRELAALHEGMAETAVDAKKSH